MSLPARGFPESEFRTRVQNAQVLMEQAGLAALLLTTEPEVRYYTGFLTRFWESPTRPWFVIVPAQGDPVAVIPEIGRHLMGQGWIKDIRTWDAPDYADDGISLLAETIVECVPDGECVGLAMGHESHARMPVANLASLQQRLATRVVVDDAQITARLRLIKSEAEIAKITQAVSIADRAFDRVGEVARVGAPLQEVFRRFQILCLEEGADWVPYLAGGAGQGGYGDVISPATEAPLAEGDVLMLDTGLVWDGYFCDFDRNYSIGPPDPAVARAHGALIDATKAAFAAARPGATFSDLFGVMQARLNLPDRCGRLGHGLGMQLTEGPSIIRQDETELQPGMVLTLEPWVPVRDGRIMVHEENIVITPDGCRFLGRPSLPDIRVVG